MEQFSLPAFGATTPPEPENGNNRCMKRGNKIRGDSLPANVCPKSCTAAADNFSYKRIAASENQCGNGSCKGLSCEGPAAGPAWPNRHAKKLFCRQQALVNAVSHLPVQPTCALHPAENISGTAAVAGRSDIGIGCRMPPMPRENFGQEHDTVEGCCRKGQYHVVATVTGQWRGVGHKSE